jgi:hypothetical protein
LSGIQDDLLTAKGSVVLIDWLVAISFLLHNYRSGGYLNRRGYLDYGGYLNRRNFSHNLSHNFRLGVLNYRFITHCILLFEL